MPLAAFPKCFLNAMCVERTMSVDQWLDLTRDFDIDGLEFYWNFTPWRDPAEMDRIRRRVEDEGRSIPMMCYSPDFTIPDAAERRREVEQELVAIDACGALGVKYLRVLSGQRRPGVTRKQGIAWAAECIRALLPAAEKAGVTLVLENHYKDGFWEYPEFAQKQELFLELLDAIGCSPWFGVNFDPSNCLIAGEDPLALLEAVKHRVVTMHASDRYFEGGTLEDLQRLESNPVRGYADILKHGVIGKGLNDYDRIFSTLAAAGFRGWVSIEDGADPVRGAAEIAESARFLRGKMRLHGLD
jgi:sugar phosphate isomerase/epimerase